MEEIKELKERVTRLERKYAKAGRSSSGRSSSSTISVLNVTPASSTARAEVQAAALEAPSSSPRYNGSSEDELMDSVRHLDRLYDVILHLLTQLFPVDYILSHSVTGQASNQSRAAKPMFDSTLYGIMVKKVVKTKFPQVQRTAITSKVHAVQKHFKNKPKK